MTTHEKINYVEFPTTDIEASKAFFTAAFGWTFVDFGPNYASFTDQGLDGGFFKSDKAATTDHGSVLVVLYSEALEETQQRVEAAGGTILKPVFDFPGGRRFHFADPAGNELAVWSDKPAT